MPTNLGKKLAALAVHKLANPILAKLVRELHGSLPIGRRGFNDGNGLHSDYVNNRNSAHTDLTQECFKPYEFADSDYTDITYRDGTRVSHGDETRWDDSHTDSGRYEDYSDMCR